MATSTSRLALIKPDPGEIQDITVLNANSDKIDTYNGFHQCTSGTRPAAPWDGLQIRETDTNATLYWDGTRWNYIEYSALWTPAMKATTTNPGAGTSQGWWQRNRNIVTASFRSAITTAGNGTYYLDLPFPCATADLAMVCGVVKARNGTVRNYEGIMEIHPTDVNRVKMFVDIGTDVTDINHNAPVAWSTGSFFAGTFSYRTNPL